MHKIFFLAILFIIPSSYAATIFYTNQTTWQNTVGSYVSLVTTAANVVKSDEVVATPGVNTGISGTLTWRAANTGLGFDFRLTALQSGAGITFDDEESSGNPVAYDNALSIGDIDNYENDDWKIQFLGGEYVYAFGFLLCDNEGTIDSFSVYAHDGSLLGTISGASIPNSPGTKVFLGVISDKPIGWVQYDDDSTGDDIAIANFQFSTIPEPNTIFLGILGSMFLAILKRK